MAHKNALEQARPEPCAMFFKVGFPSCHNFQMKLCHEQGAHGFVPVIQIIPPVKKLLE